MGAKVAIIGWLAVAAVAACGPPVPMTEPAIQRGAIASIAPPTVGSPVEVAVTLDDLPRHGSLPPGSSRLAIHERLVDTFRMHHMPPVTGFVNGIGVQTPDDRAAIGAWLAAGNRLGNHTYSHLDVRKVPVADYMGDIDRNEAILEELSRAHGQPGDYKTFRFPFLEEGIDATMRGTLRRHLLGRGYRISAVTVDFGDWAWNEPYARCLARNDERALAALRRTFLGNAKTFLRWSVEAARQIYGRPIRHVLLLHAGPFDAEVLDELLGAYEKQGVRFISLEQALEDPAYQVDVGAAPTLGATLLEQVIDAKHAPHPPFPLQPLPLLDALCR